MNTLENEETRGKRERWWRSAFLIVATIYVSILLIGLLVRILGGFTQIALILFVAWLLAFILAPVVGWVHRRWLPRGAAIGVVYAATLLVSGFVLFYAASSIGASMGEMAEDFPLTKARIEGFLNDLERAVAFGRFDPDLVGLYRDVEATVGRIGLEMVGDVPSVTVAVLGALLLVIILSLYMLADSSNILARFGRIIPSRYADEYEILQRTVANAFGGFLRAQVILAGVQTGLTVAVVLLAGLPYPFLIVAISGIAMLIPFFGPPLALVPPLLATAIFSPELILFVAPILLVVQTVLVNYLQPRLMREALGMHPILVLVGLLIGAQVAGLWGALFGIPVLAVLNVFFTYAVNLRTIEETPAVEMDEVLEEVRRESPDATHEEIVAIAAERVEDEQVDDRVEEAAEATDEATGELREAAGDLRQAAGTEREAAAEIRTSTSDLRKGVDEVAERRPSEG